MKRLLVFLLMTVTLSSLARAQERDTTVSARRWTAENTVFAFCATSALVMDWAQATYIAEHPDKVREINPILGEHPSVGQVNVYSVSSIVGALAVAGALPNPWRNRFLKAVYMVEMLAVIWNASSGVGVSFRF